MAKRNIAAIGATVTMPSSMNLPTHVPWPNTSAAANGIAASATSGERRLLKDRHQYQPDSGQTGECEHRQCARRRSAARFSTERNHCGALGGGARRELVGHEDRHRAPRRVDEEVRVARAGPARGPSRLLVCRVARRVADGEAQRERSALFAQPGNGDLRGEERVDTRCREVVSPIERSSFGEHARESQIVGNGGDHRAPSIEEAGVIAIVGGGWLLDGGHAAVGARIKCGEARKLRLLDEKAGIGHAERREEELVERLVE